MIEDAQREVARLAATIGAPAALLPAFEPGASDWWIAAEGSRYQLAFEDEGRIARTLTFPTLDALLEDVFGHVTYAMAAEWEHENRVLDVDYRRLLYARQERLLARLSPAWGERAREKNRGVLDAYPADG